MTSLKRKRIKYLEVAEIMELAKNLPLEIHDNIQLPEVAELVNLASRAQLSFYDTAFLWLYSGFAIGHKPTETGWQRGSSTNRSVQIYYPICAFQTEAQDQLAKRG